MNIDEIITLDDGKEYLLLFKSNLNNENYYLASEFVNEQPTENYEVIKEVNNNGEIWVEMIDDSELQDQLLDAFEAEIDAMKEETNNNN